MRSSWCDEKCLRVVGWWQAMLGWEWRVKDYCSGTLSRGRGSFWISDDVVSVSFASPVKRGRGKRPQVRPPRFSTSMTWRARGCKRQYGGCLGLRMSRRNSGPSRTLADSLGSAVRGEWVGVADDALGARDGTGWDLRRRKDGKCARRRRSGKGLGWLTAGGSRNRGMNGICLYNRRRRESGWASKQHGRELSS